LRGVYRAGWTPTARHYTRPSPSPSLTPAPPKHSPVSPRSFSPLTPGPTPTPRPLPPPPAPACPRRQPRPDSGRRTGGGSGGKGGGEVWRWTGRFGASAGLWLQRSLLSEQFPCGHLEGETKQTFVAASHSLSGNPRRFQVRPPALARDAHAVIARGQSRPTGCRRASCGMAGGCSGGSGDGWAWLQALVQDFAHICRRQQTADALIAYQM
jgi:hypothetical protein